MFLFGDFVWLPYLASSHPSSWTWNLISINLYIKLPCHHISELLIFSWYGMFSIANNNFRMGRCYVVFGVWEEQAAQRRGWHFLMTFSHHEVFTVQRCTTLVGIGTTRTWLALGLFLGRVGRFLDFEPIDYYFSRYPIELQCHGDCSVVESS